MSISATAKTTAKLGKSFKTYLDELCATPTLERLNVKAWYDEFFYSLDPHTRNLLFQSLRKKRH